MLQRSGDLCFMDVRSGRIRAGFRETASVEEWSGIDFEVWL
jgi:hypothetical protein